jgi:hypothetical protein
MAHTVAEHTNGTQRGRTPPALPEHTFKDSGVTIRIRKVGPTTQQRLAQQIMRELPEPAIPIVTTEIGPEANDADPQYLLDKQAWEQKTRSELTNRLMLMAALESEVEIDDRARADIARKRRSYQIAHIPIDDDPTMTDEENERVFYILHVCCASPEDLGEFGQAVLRRSVPTEDAVQAQIATFQRDVSE